MDERIRTAIADVPQSQPPLTSADVEEIARGIVASIPPSRPLPNTPNSSSTTPSAGTRPRASTPPSPTTTAPESIDGQWYVFIIDENDLVIGHPDAHRLGLDVKGWVGTDANGYNFGPDMLSATEDGKWVSYVYRNPESGELGASYTGELELKNAWVVKHDGLLFASGWYVNADELHQGHGLHSRSRVSPGRAGGDHRLLRQPRERFCGTGGDHWVLQQRRKR